VPRKNEALVVVNYQKNAEAAATVVREIEAAGGETFPVQGDVGSVQGIRQFFQSLDTELTKRRGSNRFDILVNNAGIFTVGNVASSSTACPPPQSLAMNHFSSYD
jgi:3-oxoacyl-[acyl-carrier protein] reductase